MTYVIIAHLTDRIIAPDIHAEAVTAFLSARADTSRYTILGADGSSLNGATWLRRHAAATSVAA